MAEIQNMLIKGKEIQYKIGNKYIEFINEDKTEVIKIKEILEIENSENTANKQTLSIPLMKKYIEEEMEDFLK